MGRLGEGDGSHLHARLRQGPWATGAPPVAKEVPLPCQRLRFHCQGLSCLGGGGGGGQGVTPEAHPPGLSLMKPSTNGG